MVRARRAVGLAGLAACISAAPAGDAVAGSNGRADQPRIYRQAVTESCNAPAGDVCEVQGTSTPTGLVSGFAHYETGGLPSESAAWGYGGGLQMAAHRVPRGAKKLVYSATWEIVPYDDPRTIEQESSGLKAASAGAGFSTVSGALFVRPPGCRSSECVLGSSESFIHSSPAAPGETTLAPGERRTMKVTMAAPSGEELPRGTATLDARIYPGAGTWLRLPGSSGEASGAARLVSLTAEVTD